MTPIITLLVLAGAFAVVSVLGSPYIGPRRYHRAKEQPYECGIEASPQSDRARFSVKYYLTAMLFIIFDVETVFLIPWAVHFDALGVFAFAQVLIFLALVIVAFAYEWRKGGLEWE